MKTYATIQQNSTKENMILIDSKLSKLGEDIVQCWLDIKLHLQMYNTNNKDIKYPVSLTYKFMKRQSCNKNNLVKVMKKRYYFVEHIHAKIVVIS